MQFVSIKIFCRKEFSEIISIITIIPTEDVSPGVERANVASTSAKEVLAVYRLKYVERLSVVLAIAASVGGGY